MSEHDLCLFVILTPEGERLALALEARRIILWAGSLVEDGEEIGGIKQQLRRASHHLGLHEGIVWRAYECRCGPKIFPTIEEARNKLLQRYIAKNKDH